MSDLVLDGFVRARACANIALAKYWGKTPGRRPQDANLPAVPSLSLTLKGLETETLVCFNPEASADSVTLNGEALSGPQLDRAVQVLDRVRELADVVAPFRVVSVNEVPTAAGLASSASGMAALTAAAARCAGLPMDLDALSGVARIGSGSASRSLHGGWVTWTGPEASQVAKAEHWDVSMVVALVDRGPKSIGSREAMNRSRDTSPFYGAWVETAPQLYAEILDGVLARDLDRVARAMEASTTRMHAVAMTASPPIVYGNQMTWRVVDRVSRLRTESGIPCGFTMDAGPNVKVLVESSSVASVVEALEAMGCETLVAGPGGPVEVSVEQGTLP